MKASCYLVLRPMRPYWDKTKLTGFKIARSTQTKPSLLAGEAAVKVTIEADAGLFDPQEVGVVVQVRSAMIAAEQEEIEP